MCVTRETLSVTRPARRNNGGKERERDETEDKEEEKGETEAKREEGENDRG